VAGHESPSPMAATATAVPLRGDNNEGRRRHSIRSWPSRSGSDVRHRRDQGGPGRLGADPEIRKVSPSVPVHPMQRIMGVRGHDDLRAQPWRTNQSSTTPPTATGSRRRSCRSPGRTHTSMPARLRGCRRESRSPLTTNVGRPVSSRRPGSSPAGPARAAERPARPPRPRPPRRPYGRPPGRRWTGRPPESVRPDRATRRPREGRVELAPVAGARPAGQPVRLGDPGHRDPTGHRRIADGSRSGASTSPPAPCPGRAAPVDPRRVQVDAGGDRCGRGHGPMVRVGRSGCHPIDQIDQLPLLRSNGSRVRCSG